MLDQDRAVISSRFLVRYSSVFAQSECPVCVQAKTASRGYPGRRMDAKARKATLRKESSGEVWASPVKATRVFRAR
jgi:hypothetical protein